VHGLAVMGLAEHVEDRDGQRLVAERGIERLAGLLAVEPLELPRVA